MSRTPAVPAAAKVSNGLCPRANHQTPTKTPAVAAISRLPATGTASRMSGGGHTGRSGTRAGSRRRRIRADPTMLPAMAEKAPTTMPRRMRLATQLVA